MIKARIHFCLTLLAFSSCAFATPAPKQGMVVTEQKLASQIGLDILKAGGNAIDAAVAVGYALAVVTPCCGNIGGGGFMTIHLATGKTVFLNFREKAPQQASKDMFLDKHGNLIADASIKGYLAVGVPGTVLGLETALQQYGSMTRQQVMAPAIRLAERGYVVTPFDAKWFAVFAKDFKTQPNVAAIFLKQGQPYRAGERLIQTNLATSLKLIAEKGPAAFYKGPLAKAIVDASAAHGGILTLADFANYSVEELTPIRCDYRGYTIFSAPPPSSGGVTLCEMLNILQFFPLKQLGYHSTESVRDMLESMRYGFTDRNTQLGDPNFVDNPITRLLSKEYAAKLSEKIRNSQGIPHTDHAPLSVMQENMDTTHYSVIDNKGNAVAVTYTLNGFFGARIIAGNTGFFLNDEMDDFTAKAGSANKFGLVQHDANTIQPGKRPLSSMSPTIVMKNGRVFMILGSPGGPRIITTVLQTILNVVDYGMPIQQAVDAPRLHYQVLPDSVEVEPLALSATVTKQLQQMGYVITPEGTWSAVEAILVDPVNGELHGGSDYRRENGAAVGY